MIYKLKTKEVAGFVKLSEPLGLTQLEDNQVELDIDPTVADQLRAEGEVSGFSIDEIPIEVPVEQEASIEEEAPADEEVPEEKPKKKTTKRRK